MKAMFSEKYYREFWDKFMDFDPLWSDEHHVNLEYDLELKMKAYMESGLPEEVLSVVRKVMAQEVADECYKLVKKEAGVVKRIESGKSTFGMISERQEIERRGEYRRRFEFNCLQLADFKKKYSLS